jgi:uncharacterized protein (TIGR00725 family)
MSEWYGSKPVTHYDLRILSFSIYYLSLITHYWFKNMQKMFIGVIGASQCSPEGYDLAREVGRLIAEGGAALVCGGLLGIMEGACRGCAEAGGEAVGILPGADRAAANPFVTLAVPTGMGHARNVIIAQTARVLIAVEGQFGTLSEIAIGLKLGRPVIVLRGWSGIDGVIHVSSAKEAVSRAFTFLRQPECHP